MGWQKIMPYYKFIILSIGDDSKCFNMSETDPACVKTNGGVFWFFLESIPK